MLQENKISRVGWNKNIEVDWYVVATTNKNLKENITNGNFREDLYCRIAVTLIKVPTLNDRKEDILLLINFFANKQGSVKKKFLNEAISLLKEYNWTGNVRELRNVIEKLLILGEKEIFGNDVKLFLSK